MCTLEQTGAKIACRHDPLLGLNDRISQERGSQCRADAYLLPEDSLQPRRRKVQESAYFDRQKPIGGIHEIDRQ